MVHFIVGALLGVLLLNPVAMAITWLELRMEQSVAATNFGKFLLSRLAATFSGRMLAMTFLYAAIGGSNGLVFHALEKALEKREEAVKRLRYEIAEDIPLVISAGEGDRVEFKSTARWDLHHERVNKDLEITIAKTIAGFANSAGGSLLVGVNDEGSVIGIDKDYQTLKRKDRDGFEQPPHGKKRTAPNLGSGVIVSADGTILTNSHVVAKAEKLLVVLRGKKTYPAEIIGTDPETDLAVIKFEAEGLPAASLADSEEVKVGQWVIAVGNPLGMMHTVTAGIISAIGRSSVGVAKYEDFMQTDASINPGNSGGALADLNGDVIGINTAIASPSGGSVGIGLAIPINLAREVLDALISRGKRAPERRRQDE